MLGYYTYYSQLTRFFRLFSYSKMVKRWYKHSLLLKYFKRFCSAYDIEENMARTILIYSSRVCLNTTLLFPVIYILSRKLMESWVQITPSNQCLWYCECPPPPLPHTLDIDDSGGTINAVWAMLHPLGTLPDINTDYTPVASTTPWLYASCIHHSL